MTLQNQRYIKTICLTLCVFPLLCLIGGSCASLPPDYKLIIAFTADPPKINEGDTVTLSWTVVDALSCSIVVIAEDRTETDPEEVECEATKQDAPSRTTTYRLLAEAVPGSENRDEQFDRIVLVTAIVQFEADKTEVRSGEEITLFWEAVNTNSCFITFLPNGGISSEPLSVPCKGSQAFTPKEPTTDYRFSVLKTDGETFLEERLTVVVNPVIAP